jgi:hypothetical protein
MLGIIPELDMDDNHHIFHDHPWPNRFNFWVRDDPKPKWMMIPKNRRGSSHDFDDWNILKPPSKWGLLCRKTIGFPLQMYGGGTVNVPIQEQFWEDMNHQDKTHAIPITLMVLTNPNGLYYHLKEYGNGYGSKLWSPQSGCFKPVGRPKLLRMTRLKRRCFGTALTPSDSNVKLLNHPATSVPESFKNSPEIWLLKLS